MVPTSVLIVAVYVFEGSIVMGGAGNCGLGRVAVGLDGHPAALEAWSAACWAADTLGAVVVVVDVAVDLAGGLKRRIDTPTTTASAMTMVMPRRSPFLRLAAFSAASRRAWRPAFCRSRFSVPTDEQGSRSHRGVRSAPGMATADTWVRPRGHRAAGCSLVGHVSRGPEVRWHVGRRRRPDPGRGRPRGPDPPRRQRRRRGGQRHG